MKSSIKNIVLAAAAGSVLLPAIAAASNFQYDGVELSYGTADFDGAPDRGVSKFDLEAASIELNYSIKPNIVIGGSYINGTGKPDFSLQGGGTRRGKYSLTGPAVFAFYHADYNEKLSYRVGAEYAKLKSKFSAPNVTGLEVLNDNSATKSVIGGVRFQFNEKIELELDAEYDLDAESGEDKLGYGIGARYQVLPDVDVAIGVEFTDGDHSPSISVKKYFDFSR